MKDSSTYRVLHLEDDPFDVEMVQDRLKSEGIICEFDIVAHEKEFIDKLNSGNYSLIISDFSLPDFDGMKALELAKKICPQTPFIIVSGTIGEERAADCIKRGADDYILKSNTTRLVSTVKRALKESTLIASNIEIKSSLLQSEAHFKAIYESALNAIITMDHQGKIVEVNQAFEHIFGFDRQTVVGKKMVDLIVPEPYKKDCNNGLQRYLKTKKSKIVGKQLEMSALNAKGKEFPIEIALQVIDSGENPVFTASIQDISLRKQIEDKIKTLNEELEVKVKERTKDLQATNSKLSQTLKDLQFAQNKLVQSEKLASIGQLTAGIAHELNNPLNFINAGAVGLEKDFEDLIAIMEKYDELDNGKSTSQMLESIEAAKSEVDYDYLKENVMATIEDIKMGAERTTLIVRGLRNFSRLDTQEKVMSNLHEGIENTLTLLDSKLKHKVEVIRKFDPTINEIKCYPGQLNQVFLNLILNAEQSIRTKGQIKITTKNLGNHTQISVEDNGSGMDKKTQQRIFEPFFTTKETGSGTGLGLSITYGIIQRHKGSISVNSIHGKGSKFTIELKNK